MKEGEKWNEGRNEHGMEDNRNGMNKRIVTNWVMYVIRLIYAKAKNIARPFQAMHNLEKNYYVSSCSNSKNDLLLKKENKPLHLAFGGNGMSLTPCYP